MRSPGRLLSFCSVRLALPAVCEFVEFVVVEHSDQSVQVPERVADLIGQLAGAVGAAPVSGRRAGHASRGNIRSFGHVSGVSCTGYRAVGQLLFGPAVEGLDQLMQSAG